jgi:Tfp pilus assembly protein PilO
MNSDINLVKKEIRSTANRLKIIRAIALALALLVAISSTGLFLITRQNSLDSIKAEQDTLLQNISQLGQKAAKLNFLNDRIRNIENILNERKNYVDSVDMLLSGTPSNVSVVSLTLDEQDMLLTVNSSSLAAINDFLSSTITFVEEKHLLKDLTIESLSAQSNQYTLTLKAKLL